MKSRIYKLNIIKIGSKKFIVQDNKAQCACCLYAQPTSINSKWIKDKDGCYSHAYLKLEDEQHTEDCKQRNIE